ncbi:Periplasmic dipeptide transport protein [Anaerolineae bacterium]|nr:Periplasmic dipeptide transport protein [Anaerolineae bacterium]
MKEKSVRFVLIAMMLTAIVILGGCAQPTAVPAPTSVPAPAATSAPTQAPTSAPAPVATLAPVATSAPAATTAPTAAPKPSVKQPSGTLNVALSTFESETFLPWNGGVARQSYLLMIYDVLVYSDPKTDQQLPGLAEKWEMSPDGKTWTFFIRKGVQFHEGYGELTADDVKFSFERMIDKTSVGSPAQLLRNIIDKVETPEAYKVVVSLKTPYVGLVGGYLNDTNAGGIIVSKKYVTAVGDEKANAHPIGTGPYTLAEDHKKGGPIKLKTVDGVERHWRLTPDYQNVNFLLVPEEATRVAMLKNGEADVAPISYDSIDTIKSSGLNVVSIPKNWAPLIRFGGIVTTDPKRYDANNPWSKKEVRQALNYAIDRAAIAKSIFKGEATPVGASMPLNVWSDIPAYPYDPAKAKQLLTQAGYPNGFQLPLRTFTANPGAELPTIGEAVALYWKAIGVDVKIVPSDWNTVRGDLLGAKANSYLFVQRGQPFVDFQAGFDLEYDANNMFAIYATPEVIAKYTQVKGELDPKKREQLARDFGLYVKDEATNVFLVFANDPYGVSKKVGQWTSIRMRPQNIESITRP